MHVAYIGYLKKKKEEVFFSLLQVGQENNPFSMAQNFHNPLLESCHQYLG